MKTFCVVGHDARQRAAAQTLQAAGFRIIGPEAACQADCVLLPMSQERVSDAVARTLQGVRPGTLLLAGRPGSPIQAAARQASLPLLDYFQRPELECLNAVPTAEGCLALLLQLRRRTIWESDFLVLGYGRIGRQLARRLAAFGARVTVAARRPESRALAETDGFHSVDIMSISGTYDAVVNTVPAPVLRGGFDGALCLDLASAPGGWADETPVLHAPGLPGQYAPALAARILRDAVYETLREDEQWKS